VVGRRDYGELRRRWDEQGSPERYTLIEYEPDLGDVLAAADLGGRPRRGLGDGDRGGGPARDPDPLPARDGDHQTTNAAGWPTAARRW
jgi:hypothetical protein